MLLLASNDSVVVNIQGYKTSTYTTHQSRFLTVLKIGGIYGSEATNKSEIFTLTTYLSSRFRSRKPKG
jgi:hypothetical protein